MESHWIWTGREQKGRHSKQEKQAVERENGSEPVVRGLSGDKLACRGLRAEPGLGQGGAARSREGRAWAQRATENHCSNDSPRERGI